MSARRGGFTIIEVLVAIVMLSIGVLALASSAGSVSRMLSNGQRKSQSYSVLSSTMDSLRNRANSTSPKCTALVSSTASDARGYGTLFSRQWIVSNWNVSGRIIEVRTAYRVGPRAKGDTLIAQIDC